MIKILFLAANPFDSDPLRLSEEVRAINERLRLSNLRDEFVVEQEWAVRTTDLVTSLLNHKPHIVHFSGHGSRAGTIILEDEKGQSQPVSSLALKRIFEVPKGNIRCVVLNATYTESQADAIVESVDCVVGLDRAIPDDSAISFAAAFYEALGYGRSIREAFDLGCLQIDLQGWQKASSRRDLAPSSLTSEVDITPKLRVAAGVDPASIYLVKSAVGASAREREPALHGASKAGLDDPVRDATIDPINLFYSYSYKDEKLNDQFEGHLSVLMRQGVITGWHDRRIGTGKEWAGKISEYLESAQVILFLISPSFLDSDYLFDVEVKRALERQQQNEARVIPILLRPVDWQGTPLDRLKVLPRNATAVTSWKLRDRAFVDVRNGIREAIDDIKLVYAYTVIKPGGMDSSEFDIYIDLLATMRIDISNVSRIPEPSNSGRWLYVWNTRLEADGFAGELRRRTGDLTWSVHKCERSSLTKGPLAPLEINATSTKLGTAFRLHPQSLDRILKSYPNTRLAPEVIWETAEHPHLAQTDKESWRQLTLLLTGLSQEQVDQLGGFKILEASGKDLFESRESSLSN
jgi:TIR domain/CHAT domain